MDDHTPTTEEYDVFIEGDLQNGPEPCDKYDARVLSAQLLPPLYSVVFLAGLLDNGLVALILGKYRGLARVENIYFLNLAVANLLFSLILPFWAHGASRGGLLGEPLCEILAGVYSVGLYSEAIFNALLTARLVLRARRRLRAAGTARCGAATTALVWAGVAAAALPELAARKPRGEGWRDACTLDRPHFLPTDGTFWKYFLTLKMNILGLLFPLFVLVFCSALTRRTLRSGERSQDLVKLTLAIMVVFLLMWAPYNIALFLSTFKEYFSLHDCKSSYNLDRSIQITKIVAATHCCVSPLLYVVFDKTFRKHLCHLFHLCHKAPLQPHEESGRDMLREQRDQSTRV